MPSSPTPIGIRCNACNCTWTRAPLPSLFDDCPQCGKSDVLRPDYETEREALKGAFEALLSLVASKAAKIAGPGYHPDGPLTQDHRVWALFGKWRAGAESADEAREALKDVIRAALIEQTGGTDAA
jgi:hypothetical protein